LTQVTVTLDLLVRKTLREPYLAIFCEPEKVTVTWPAFEL